MLPAVEIRRGGRLHGVMVTEGRAASGGRREVFAPGSVEWPSNGVGILTRHRTSPVVRAMPERRDLGRIVLDAPAPQEIREAVEGGRRYMSVEFHSLEERTTAGGVREILRAMVPDVALVDSPEYDTTAAEVRRRLGPSIRGKVPTGKGIDCSCPGDGCDTIRFEVESFLHLDGADNILLTSGNMSQVVGRAVLSASREGLAITGDLLDVSAARDLLALVAGGVPIFARPLIDVEASDTSEDRREGGTLTVRRAVFNAILVKAVARGVSGMDPVEVTPRNRRNRRGRGGVAGESAPESILARSGRRRIWL